MSYARAHGTEPGFGTGEHRQRTGNRAVQTNRHLAGQKADDEWPRPGPAAGEQGVRGGRLRIGPRDVAQLG